MQNKQQTNPTPGSLFSAAIGFAVAGMVLAGIAHAQAYRTTPSDAKAARGYQTNGYESGQYDTAGYDTRAQPTGDESGIVRALHYIRDNSYFSVGAAYFQYFGNSTDLRGEGSGAAILESSVGNPIPDSGSSISDKTTLGGTYGLFLPHTDHHLAIEFALAPPLKLEFEAKGTAADLGREPPFSALTGGKATGERVGDFRTLPPNFTLVYRPFLDTVIQPYIGAGAMYLYSYNIDVDNPQLIAQSEALGNGDPTLYLSKPLACVAQLGADVDLPGNLFLTAGARYIGCADVEATLNLGDGNTLTNNNHFHALLYQVGLGVGF